MNLDEIKKIALIASDYFETNDELAKKLGLSGSYCFLVNQDSLKLLFETLPWANFYVEVDVGHLYIPLHSGDVRVEPVNEFATTLFAITKKEAKRVWSQVVRDRFLMVSVKDGLFKEDKPTIVLKNLKRVCIDVEGLRE